MRPVHPATAAALGGLLFGTLAWGLPSVGESVIHETARVPQGWTRAGSARDSAPLSLSVALKQPGLDRLRDRLHAASDPGHVDYGAHVAYDEMRVLQAPGADAVEAVTLWLRRAGVSELRFEDAWVRFNTTVRDASALLGSEFGTYLGDAGEVIRAETYSLPKTLTGFVDFVYPVTQFISPPQRREVVEMDSTPRLDRRQTSLPQSCREFTTPACLVDLYDINYTPPEGPSPTEFGIAGFLGEVPDQALVTDFLGQYSPRVNASGYSAAGYNLTVEYINGGEAEPRGAGVEALLDSYYSMPFVQPMNVTYFSTGGRGPDLSGPNRTDVGETQSQNEPWVEFLEHLLKRETVPHVISISYTDDEQLIPEAYARRVCDLFMQVAARGVSVLVATGDGGAAGIRSGDCVSNDGSRTPKFIPTFPVDCPYVTAVGAVGNYFPLEPAWFSSGGFSEYFERPSWQDAAVTEFLDRIGDSHEGWYNRQGRGYPDLSAVGVRFLMQAPGWMQKGTSASTPVVAAMVALANDKRMREGKPALGFLNPLLYSDKMRAAGVFTDVAAGSSGSCPVGDDGLEFEPGWEATEGWDAGSGLGTLNFAKFVEALG